jgi:hypothetical protein
MDHDCGAGTEEVRNKTDARTTADRVKKSILERVFASRHPTETSSTPAHTAQQPLPIDPDNRTTKEDPKLLLQEAGGERFSCERERRAKMSGGTYHMLLGRRFPLLTWLGRGCDWWFGSVGRLHLPHAASSSKTNGGDLACLVLDALSPAARSPKESSSGSWFSPSDRSDSNDNNRLSVGSWRQGQRDGSTHTAANPVIRTIVIWTLTPTTP